MVICTTHTFCKNVSERIFCMRDGGKMKSMLLYMFRKKDMNKDEK